MRSGRTVDPMPPDEFRTPLTLRGRWVELRPLDRAYRAEILAAGSDPRVGQLLRDPPGATLENVDRYLDLLFAAFDAGTDLPFVQRLVPDGPVIGATRYLRIDRRNRSVEIGGTWLHPAHWRTAVNTEAKLLLLRHAFDDEGVHRVQLQTDLRNERSQRAIERLGAVREAVLREDVRMRDGYWRSSVIYSILADEWPTVRRRLEGFLAPPR
jgi:RimJ/RimL family protein N-acetyltransferase